MRSYDNTIITMPNCGKCKILKDTLGELNTFVAWVDATECMEFCKKHNVKSVPALVCGGLLLDNPTIMTDFRKITEYLSEVAKEWEFNNGNKTKSNN